MKELYLSDLSGCDLGKEVFVSAWIAGKRHVGNYLFWDIVDSTGSIQAVLGKENFSEEDFLLAKSFSTESGIQLVGELVENHKTGIKEILVRSFEMLGEDTLKLSPRPRSNFDIFEPSIATQLLSYRHIYLRNPKIMAILQFRSNLMQIVREWFMLNRFMEFDAPILTPTPLYHGKTAIPVTVHGEDVFLSQCAGFYLEAAAHAFERVFNMGPSFRGEESRSKRHLMEYWHIKAEITFGNREDIISMVEDVLGFITKECQARCQNVFETLGTELCTDGLKVPFPRISYEEAVKYLQEKGFDSVFGEGISTAEEEELSKLYDSPFWIVGIPRSVEPFPYVVDPDDTRVTRVADLIASRGCGELLGVAEKIHDPQMLEERMQEKDKHNDPNYQFVKEVHQAGCVPHIAFGMGLERLIRWLLGIPHVRDAIPFPRVVRRNIYP
jgi:asparaginyl-tRNA synthetase